MKFLNTLEISKG